MPARCFRRQVWSRLHQLPRLRQHRQRRLLHRQRRLLHRRPHWPLPRTTPLPARDTRYQPARTSPPSPPSRSQEDKSTGPTRAPLERRTRPTSTRFQEDRCKWPSTSTRFKEDRCTGPRVPLDNTQLQRLHPGRTAGACRCVTEVNSVTGRGASGCTRAKVTKIMMIRMMSLMMI